MAILTGQQEVAAAGTPEPLLSAVSTAVRFVAISAQPGNTKCVTIGDVNTRATAGAEIGVALLPSHGPLVLNQDDHGIGDLKDLHVDAQVNGEGVCFTYGTA